MTPDFLDDMTNREALVLWTFGGYGPAESFPGVRLARVLMFRGVDNKGRRAMARMFADLAPHTAARLVLALLLVLTIRPAGIALPAPAPIRLSPQRRSHRFTPARAP